MHCVLIWTSGDCLSKNYACIEYLRSIESIRIIGITTTTKYNFFDYIDGMPFIDINEVKYLNFDIVIIFENNYDFYKAIRKCFIDYGFHDRQIINYSVINRLGFDIDKYLLIKQHTPTLLSPNCWAGITYNYLQLEFRSPTINMFFSSSDDYIKFLNNLDFYLNSELKFEKLGYENNLKHEYPICKCDDITLHFNHYLSFDDAEKSWKRRLLRVDYSNIFAMFYCENDDLLEKFLQTPYPKKICFTSYKSSMVEHNENVIYVNYKDNVLIKDAPFWDVVVNMAKGNFLYYNIFDILSRGVSNSYARFKKV